jgi:hypothetical protein
MASFIDCAKKYWFGVKHPNKMITYDIIMTLRLSWKDVKSLIQSFASFVCLVYTELFK